MQQSRRHSALLVLAVTALGAAVSTCGRVSFIDDGQTGDGGVYLKGSSTSGGAGSGQTSSSADPCGPDRGARPELQVTVDDVTQPFIDGWNTRSCGSCHGEVQGAFQFVPAMPVDPSTDKTKAAASLSRYCEALGAVATEDLTNDVGLGNTRLLCRLIPVADSMVEDCEHTGTPSNTETLDAVRSMGAPCVTAAARYRTALHAWLDAGPPPEAGNCETSSSGGAGSSGGEGIACPRPDLADEFDAVYAVAGESCLHCHAGGFVPEASCFDLGDKQRAHEQFCDHAHTDTGPLRAATYEESYLYRATRDDVNLRLTCGTLTHEYHQDFMTEGMDDAARAWYQAVISPVP